MPKEERPATFELSELVRSEADIQLIVESLRAAVLKQFKAELTAPSKLQLQLQVQLRQYLDLDVRPEIIGQGNLTRDAK